MWRPARPLPLYGMLGRCRCSCGKTFMSERRYGDHWDREHEADAFLTPDHPSSQTPDKGMNE